jgi:hypothetical protein
VKTYIQAFTRGKTVLISITYRLVVKGNLDMEWGKYENSAHTFKLNDD